MDDRVVGLILAGGAGRRLGGIDKGLMLLEGRPLVHWVAEALRPQVSRLLISANRHPEQYQQLGWPVLADAWPSSDDPSRTPDQDRYQGPLAGIATALRWLNAHRRTSLADRQPGSIQQQPGSVQQQPPVSALDDLDQPPSSATSGRPMTVERKRSSAAMSARDQSAPLPLQQDQGIAADPGAVWLLVSPCDTPLLPTDLGRRLIEALRSQGARVGIVADRERTHPLPLLIPTDIGPDLDAYLASGGRSVFGWLQRHRIATATFEQQPSPFLNLNRPLDAEVIGKQLQASATSAASAASAVDRLSLNWISST
jgi:molybdopterin-guanine dinucleotide biosynthesis protein A